MEQGNTYSFGFAVLADPDNEEVENVFLDEPFNDCTLSLQDGVLSVLFDRHAESYLDAVTSAWEDISSAGVAVVAFITEVSSSISSLRVKFGVALTFTLPENGTTGFLWELSGEQDHVVTRSPAASKENLGDGCVASFQFQPLPRGTRTLVFQSRRPWMEQPAEVRTVQVSVE